VPPNSSVAAASLCSIFIPHTGSTTMSATPPIIWCPRAGSLRLISRFFGGLLTWYLMAWPRVYKKIYFWRLFAGDVITNKYQFGDCMEVLDMQSQLLTPVVA
jgi:hypothetical protein